MIFFNFFYVFEILKNERNNTNFRYVFVPRFHIMHKNFSGVWTNGYSLIFYKNIILINVKKIEKNHTDSVKSIDLFKVKKR